MSEPEGYPAGTDVPGTPGPFPAALLSIGPASLSFCLFLFGGFLGLPGWAAWAVALPWLALAVIGVSRGQWIVPVAGLGLIAAGAAIASTGAIGS